MSRRAANLSARRVVARAFSLVEILIAIIILALGVLGLGALFPAIIRQQREGADAVQGVIAANTARSVLAGTDWASLLPRGWDSSGGGIPAIPLDPPAPSFWGLVREDRDGLFDRATPADLEACKRGRWLVPNLDAMGLGEVTLGSMSSSRPSGGTYPRATTIKIPVINRLIPSPGEGEPVYVWDMALQLDPSDPRNRVAAPAQPLGRIRAAVFIRRIDPGIRVPPEQTLLSLLVPVAGTGVPGRVPVGETLGREPTFDGTDGAGGVRYSPLRRAEVAFRYQPGHADYGRRDRLFIGDDTDRVLSAGQVQSALMKVGQRVVDNLGNVYTVTDFGRIGDPASGEPFITVEPPVPVSVPAPATLPAVPTTINVKRYQIETLCSVVFALQVPAEVVTLEIEP